MNEETATTVELADRQVDLVRQAVLFPDGTTGSLTTREAQLLAYLAARPEQDVSREELLDKVWSYRASYATRAVDVTMRRLRAKIEPEPQAPVHLISVHGVGYRFVPTPREGIAQPGPSLSEPAPSGPSPEPAAIPGERTAFVGRRTELAALAELLSKHRLVSVPGHGGVGKSRLVSRLVHETPGRWPGGVWWCELQTADDLGSVVAAVAATLGVVLAGTEHDMVETVGRALAGRGRSLVVLDGFERSVSHAAATVGEWLEAAAETVFLVTSRERLRLLGERVLDVPPLSAQDARALLLDRMAAAGVDTASADAEAVARVADRLERLPLAIELAAPRARLMSLDALYSRLEERFKVLRTTSRDDGRTLRAVLDGSWDLLDDEERRALTWCSTFVGGFTLEAAEAVLDVGGDTWPLDRIEALRDKSLIRVLETEDHTDPRLGLYDSVREYAAERLAERGEVALAEGRHAAFMIALGEELASGIERHGGRERMLELAAEADNLLAVVRRRTAAAPLDAVRAVLALEPLLLARGPYAVFGRLLEDVLASATAAEGIGQERMALLRLARGNILRLSGEPRAGLQDVELALELVRGTGSPAEIRAHIILSLIHFERSRIDEAAQQARAGLEIARRRRQRAQEGTLLGMLGAFATMQGSEEEAEQRFAEAIQTDEEVGNEPRAALDLSNFALLLTEIGRIDEAEEHLVAALKLHLAWHNTRGAANAHSNLTTLRSRQGRLDEAHEHAEEAIRLYRGAGYTRFAAMAEQNAALIDWARKSATEALPQLRSSVDRFVDLGDTGMVATARTYLAAAIATVGAIEEARAVLDEAALEIAKGSDPRATGIVEVARGFLAMASGDRTAAERARDGGLSSPLYGVRFLAELLKKELKAA